MTFEEEMIRGAEEVLEEAKELTRITESFLKEDRKSVALINLYRTDLFHHAIRIARDGGYDLQNLGFDVYHRNDMYKNIK